MKNCLAYDECINRCLRNWFTSSLVILLISLYTVVGPFVSSIKLSLISQDTFDGHGKILNTILSCSVFKELIPSFSQYWPIEFFTNTKKDERRRFSKDSSVLWQLKEYLNLTSYAYWFQEIIIHVTVQIWLSEVQYCTKPAEPFHIFSKACKCGIARGIQSQMMYNNLITKWM